VGAPVGHHAGAPGGFSFPDDASVRTSGTIAVADASNNRIRFLSPQGTVVGRIGNGADAHDPPVSIARPDGEAPLANSDILGSEINGSWVDEYTRSGPLVWTVHLASVNDPSDPRQLGADLFLMTDDNPPGEGRVVEFTHEGQVTWRYDARAGDDMLE